MGIVISDENNRVNKQLNTGIILIDTKITIPVATFTTQLDGSSFDTFVFTNSSLYWDFFSGEEPFLGILEMGRRFRMKLIRNINMELLAIIM